jgi:membrane-bound lytic murein transglycosylase D
LHASPLKNDKNMQYKIILSAVLFGLSALPLQAQQSSATKVTARLVNDTIVLSTAPANNNVTTQKQPVKPAAIPLLASNLAAPEVVTDRKAGYNHVPLAGEKSYFGDKDEYVKDYTRHYLESHNATLDHVNKNSLQPFSVIDNMLEQKNMPKELKYLAVIESALNHNAVSHAGAVGTWQLMETTARMMGLSVNRKKDDRRDLYKSTAAATKYLELLYSQLNDWLLVIAAYNSGPTPVQRAIERTGSHNFWDIKQYLPHETQGHVLAFIATASIFENLSKFINLGSIPDDAKFNKEEDPAPAVAALKDMAVKTGAPAHTVAVVAASTPVVAPTAPVAATATAPVVKSAPYTEEELKNMSIVRITEPLYMDLVAQELGADRKMLGRWNPDYESFVYKNYPTPYYSFRLPKDKLNTFLAKKDQMTKRSKVLFAQLK